MSQKRINILVVDDENFFAEWLAENLRDTSSNYDADWVNSGERALEFLEGHSVDLVISDIKMEGISGIDLLTQIRSRFPDIGVILMTGYDLPELKQEASRRGSLFYLEKPFSMERLETTIQEALNNWPPGGSRKETKPSTTHLTLLDALHLLHLSRSNGTLCVRSPFGEGMIYFQKGDIMHATGQGLEGEAAFTQIMSWDSDEYEARTNEPAPKRTIWREFDALVNAALESASARKETSHQLPLLDVLHLFHLSRSNKVLLVKKTENRSENRKPKTEKSEARLLDSQFSPLDSGEGLIYYRNGEIVHATCQGVEGESALTRILEWRSNSYEVLTNESAPAPSISRDFDFLINMALPVVADAGPPDTATEPIGEEHPVVGRSAFVAGEEAPSAEPDAMSNEPLETSDYSPASSPGLEDEKEGAKDSASEKREPRTERRIESEVWELEIGDRKLEASSQVPTPNSQFPIPSEDDRQDQFRDLLAASDHLGGGALINLDGSIVASTLPLAALTPAIVADLCQLFQICQTTTGRLGRGFHRQSVIQGDAGNLIISEVEGGLFLVFVTGVKAALGLALYQAGERTKKVGETVAHSLARKP